MARWPRPLLFGYTQALQNELLLAGVTTVPRQFISMLPYVVTIVAVSGFVGRVRAPAAEGKVYETEGTLQVGEQRVSRKAAKTPRKAKESSKGRMSFRTK